MNTTLIILIAVIVIALVYCAISRCFDDDDPDLNWYDNYAAPKDKHLKDLKKQMPSEQYYKNQYLVSFEDVEDCLHNDLKDVVKSAGVTCEEVWTVCKKCSKVLNKRTDC